MILDKIAQIRYRTLAAAKRTGRDPALVRIVAVTKYANLEQVRELLSSGAVDEVGENRVQDVEQKKLELGPLADKVRWRLIGHLQTNKAKKAAQLFDAVDSIDSARIAEALDKAVPEGNILPVLLQVKLSEKETQAGAAPEELEALLDAVTRLPRLKLRGLMAIAPDLEPVEAVRPHFKRMRALFERHFAGRQDAELSMGMSRDFELAVEEGATTIRIGSALFD